MPACDLADQDADWPTAQRRGEQAEGQLLEIRHRAGELAADVAGGLAVQPGQQLVYLLQQLPGARAEPGRKRLALLVGHRQQAPTRFPDGLGLRAHLRDDPGALQGERGGDRRRAGQRRTRFGGRPADQRHLAPAWRWHAGYPVASWTGHGRWLDGPSLLVYPAPARYGVPDFQLGIGERAGQQVRDG